MADDWSSMDLIFRALSEDATDIGLGMLGEQTFARPTRTGSSNSDVRILVNVGHLGRLFLPISLIVLNDTPVICQLMQVNACSVCLH